MKISSQLQSQTVKVLVDTFSVNLMSQIAREVIHNYDLNKQTGYPDSIPIPKTDAARQIVRDIKDRNKYLDFIQVLVQIHYNGFMGRKYNIKYLRNIINEVYDRGFIFDQQNRIFIENPVVRKTRNWGTLKDGEDYIFSFLRLDIVSNSTMVRKYPDSLIKKTYKDLYDIVYNAIDKRNARVWNWEGDGGLIAFYFSEKNTLVALSGIEIVNELFLYNQVKCQLGEPLHVRLAAHSGYCEYTENLEDLNKNDTIKKIVEIEAKHTSPNSFSISEVVHRSLDEQIRHLFRQTQKGSSNAIYNYQLNWEQ